MNSSVQEFREWAKQMHEAAEARAPAIALAESGWDIKWGDILKAPDVPRSPEIVDQIMEWLHPCQRTWGCAIRPDDPDRDKILEWLEKNPIGCACPGCCRQHVNFEEFAAWEKRRGIDPWKDARRWEPPW